jgi:hypothetical protein
MKSEGHFIGVNFFFQLLPLILKKYLYRLKSTFISSGHKPFIWDLPHEIDVNHNAVHLSGVLGLKWVKVRRMVLPKTALS